MVGGWGGVGRRVARDLGLGDPAKDERTGENDPLQDNIIISGRHVGFSDVVSFWGRNGWIFLLNQSFRDAGRGKKKEKKEGSD